MEPRADQIAAILATIDRQLADARPAYYVKLGAGASDAAIDAFEDEMGMKLPPAFRELYRWRDGQDPACSARFTQNWMFCSLSEVASTKKDLDGMIGLDFDDPSYWRRGWVPFLHNGGGSYLCLDLLAEGGGEPGQLLEFWKADVDRPIASPNLETWLSDLATCGCEPFE